MARLSKRAVLKGAGALGLSAFAIRVSPAPAAEAITPALVEAAKKEGKVAFYTAMDLQFAEHLRQGVRAALSGHRRAGGALRLRAHLHQDRAGARQQYPRGGRGQHLRPCALSGVEEAGWLEPYLPEDVVKHYDKAYYDRDGAYITTRVLVSPFGYNTNLVKPEETPKSFADLLDPKWAGKMVKAHPAYCGTIMNSTFQVARDLGWDYLEKLARQRVLQVQSATDTPKRIALGERAIMVDGAGYLVIRNKEAGQPVDVIYPAEGTPVATSPSAVFKASPRPNAAKLFQNWMHSREAQQILVDYARQYSPHGQTVEKPGVRKLADIKLMKEDAEGVERDAEDIKARYAKIFKV